jgi:hypothetical protein
MGTVINLAVVRAARQAADDPTCDDLGPHQLTAHMRGHAHRPAHRPQHARRPRRPRSAGNSASAGTGGRGLTPAAASHLVLYETRRGCAGKGEHADVPPAITTLAKAQAWAEDWFGMHCIPKAAGSPHSSA